MPQCDIFVDRLNVRPVDFASDFGAQAFSSGTCRTNFMAQTSIWSASLLKMVALQFAFVSGSAALVATFGSMASVSLLAGGMAVALPNVGMAIWLLPRLQTESADGAAALMVAEGAKLAATVGLLVMAVLWVGQALIWPAFIAGIIVALVANWLSLWVTRRF